MKLTVEGFEKGARIPQEYTCDGDDISPEITWEDAPAETGLFALVMDDPDAPIGTFTHWVVYNIPPGTGGLKPGIPDSGVLEDGTCQGKNGFGKKGYGGPCPPRGKEHRYYFRLYALSGDEKLKPDLQKSALMKQIGPRTIGNAEYMGKYGRK